MEKKEPFDAVILDLTVPGEGWGGLETLQKLLEIDSDVKAIVSSGYANNKALINYQEYGFVGRISKPYRLERLSEIMKEVLG